MIKSVQAQKDEINSLILSALKEILYKNMRITSTTLGYLEDEVGVFMKALTSKNKIYDYAVKIDYNELLKVFEGIIIYQLIKIDNPEYDAEFAKIGKEDKEETKEDEE